MRTHEIILDEFENPAEVVAEFNERNVEQGDTVRLVTEEDTKWALFAIAALLLLALATYFALKHKKRREDEGGQILNDIMSRKSVEEIEREIEEEYGIKMEIEHRADEEREFWNSASAKAFARAYGEDEPDYAEVPLKEPNPEYKKKCKED